MVMGARVYLELIEQMKRDANQLNLIEEDLHKKID